MHLSTKGRSSRPRSSFCSVNWRKWNPTIQCRSVIHFFFGPELLGVQWVDISLMFFLFSEDVFHERHWHADPKDTRSNSWTQKGHDYIIWSWVMPFKKSHVVYLIQIQCCLFFPIEAANMFSMSEKSWFFGRPTHKIHGKNLHDIPCIPPKKKTQTELVPQRRLTDHPCIVAK